MTTELRVTVTNVFGPLNRGDFELFGQLVELLRDAGAKEIHAIARDPDGCRKHFAGVTFHAQPGVAAGRGRLAKVRAVLRTSVLFAAARVAAAERLLPGEQRDALAAIREADLVIGCPGGYLTSSSLSYFPQIAQVMYASRRGKDCWLAPMSIGPAHGRLHRRLLRWGISGASEVYVRESWSERLCGELGIRWTRSADLAMRPALTWLESENERPPAEYVTATVVRWTFPGDDSAAAGRYHEAMATALDAASARYGLPVRLLLQVDNDREVTETVARRLRAPHEIVRVETPDEYRAILRRSRVMIGSRFHSAIFALSVGCPTVVVSYLPKARSMMEDMGLGGLVHDIGRVSGTGLVASVEALDRDADLRARAREAIFEQTQPGANPFVARLRARLGATEPREVVHA